MIWVLHEPITVQGWQGIEKVHLLEKTTAAIAFGHLQWPYVKYHQKQTKIRQGWSLYNVVFYNKKKCKCYRDHDQFFASYQLS